MKIPLKFENGYLGILELTQERQYTTIVVPEGARMVRIRTAQLERFLERERPKSASVPHDNDPTQADNDLGEADPTGNFPGNTKPTI